MKLLSDSVLRDRYDVVVVGAGLGGLTAASLLAKRGLSVLIIDQQSKPGGSCTSFKREGRVFDVGTAMIYGFGSRGFRPFHFLLNELEEPIDVVAHETLARMTFEGKEIIFWPNVDRFVDQLVRLYPEEESGLRAFYAYLRKLYDNIVTKNEIVAPPSEFSPRQGLRRLLSDPLAVLSMQRLLTTSTLALLEKYVHSPELLNFYDKLCSAYAYTTAAETPAVLAATMFIDNHVGGVYYPAGGAQMLPSTIERAFERCGGQTLYGHLVDEIVIRDGAACGVRLVDGTEISAERVVANATVWNIYGRLVRPEHIAPDRLRWARSLVPTFPSMTLYMVVDREAIPAGVHPWEIYIENRAVIDSSDLTLYINSLVDETLAPLDELVVMAIAPNLSRWPHPDEDGYHSPAYAEQKQSEAERMLDQIEQHIPGFRQHIRTLIVGTPTTIERYLLKNGGAVGGPKNQIGQEMLKRLHARSEWKHLYFCGDSTVMGTGAPATVVSGVGAANVILRELHLPDYDSRRFSNQAIRLVDKPFRRPTYVPDAPLTAANAAVAAAQCQWCEAPLCVAGCPAGIDVPGFLRRLEASNYAGAARLIRQRNPFAELCGTVCPADNLCQRECYRRTYAGSPVRIADLQRWACAQAGRDGWLRPDGAASKARVAVLGAGPAALSCAYYLALAGYRAQVLIGDEQPADGLLAWLPRTGAEVSLALEHDLAAIAAAGVTFIGESAPPGDPGALLGEYAAVYTTTAGNDAEATAGVFFGDEHTQQQSGLAEAAAAGRRAALTIQQYLVGR